MEVLNGIEIKNDPPAICNVRLWSKDALHADDYKNVSELLIENKTALLGDTELNIGDESDISDGIYCISNIINSVSRKNNNCILKNSLSVYLAV